MPRRTLSKALSSNLIFVNGKGGVGKTAIAWSIARHLAESGKRTLLVEFEDPHLPMGEIRKERQNLWHLNCETQSAFEQYAAILIKVPAVAKLFVKNNLIRYLAQAGPGMKEIVLLGKVWHERNNYDHVVIDMYSMGYAIAMFQSVKNFAKLFTGGPLHRDTQSMLQTFSSPQETAHLIVGLPEEMPLTEALELDQHLAQFFPDNPASLIANRLFPSMGSQEGAPESWSSPLPQSATDFVRKRETLEKKNLEIWQKENIDFTQIPYVLEPIQENIMGNLKEVIRD